MCVFSQEIVKKTNGIISRYFDSDTKLGNVLIIGRDHSNSYLNDKSEKYLKIYFSNKCPENNYYTSKDINILSSTNANKILMLCRANKINSIIEYGLIADQTEFDGSFLADYDNRYVEMSSLSRSNINYVFNVYNVETEMLLHSHFVKAKMKSIVIWRGKQNRAYRALIKIEENLVNVLSNQGVLK